MPNPPQDQKSLEFYPFKVPCRDDFVGQVVKLVVFALLLVHRGVVEQREMGLLRREVFAYQDHERSKGIVKVLVALRVGVRNSIGQSVALRQNGLVLSVEGFIAHAVIRIPLDPVRDWLCHGMGICYSETQRFNNRNEVGEAGPFKLCRQRVFVQPFALILCQGDLKGQLFDLQWRHEADVADVGQA